MKLRWPSQCAVCRSWARARLCDDCVTRFAPVRSRCACCALPSTHRVCGECLRVPPPFERTVGAVDYAFPWDGLIARLKFRDGLDLAPSFARLLADAVRRADAMPPSLLLPLPLGPERLRERGYNQAWEIARRLGLPADARLLMRRVDSPHQSSLPRSRRAANVRGCFAVEPRQAGRLRGQRIALVDDVMTTGASASEAARTLLEAGAASVQVWVFARTPTPGDEA